MLLEFLCSNHKSIRRPIVFSALAGKDTSNEEFVTEINGIRVLRSAVIYGANGSGKSNFIEALGFVKKLVLNSINHQPGEGIRQLPHKLETPSTDSMYRIQFMIGKIRYAFGFTLNNLMVKEEYLYYFPNGRQTKIYERTENTFEEGAKFKGKFETCKNVLKPNRLLLSCAANFSSVKEVEDVFVFFRDDLVVYNAHNLDDNWMNYSLMQMNSNAAMKSIVIQMMRMLDVNVKDLEVKIEQQKLPLNETAFPDFLSDDFKKMLMQESMNAIRAKVIYDTFETDLLGEESTGVKKLFAFLSPLIDIMINGKVLICDELETSLHEAIAHGIVQIFRSNNLNPHAQLIFSTHDTSLLDLDIFRRDQVWFTELNKEDRSTELFSLAEIKNVRKDEKFGKGYIAGRYGAIPMLNTSFANIVSTEE